MRHRKANVRFGRQRAHYKSTMRHLATSLIIHKSIATTKTKARQASRLAERLVTIGKAKTVASRRRAYAILQDRDLVSILFNEIAPLFKDRNGGYTRVMLTGRRRGDNAQMAILEFVEKPVKESTPKKKEKERATQLKEKEYAVEKEVAKAGEVREEEKLVKTKEEPAKEVKPKKEKPVHPQRPGKKPGFFKKFFGQKKGM